MKAKKDRKFVVINPKDEVVYGVALNGSLHLLVDVSDTKKPQWESDRLVLSAQEADVIGVESDHRAKMRDELPAESDSGYEIEVQDNGDVKIGCQYYDAKQVARTVALSRKLAAANKRKR